MKRIERMPLAMRARLVVVLVLLTNVAMFLAGLYIFSLYDDYRRDFIEYEIPMARGISDANTALAQLQIELDNLIERAGARRIDEGAVYREGQRLLDRFDLIRPPDEARLIGRDHTSPGVYQRFLRSIAEYRSHLMASVTAITVDLAQADAHARRASRASLEINQDAAELVWMLHEGMLYDSETLSARLYRIGLPAALLVLTFTAAIFWLVRRLATNMTRTVASLQATLARLRGGDVDMEIVPAAPTQEARDIAESLGTFRQTLRELASVRADLARQVEERTQRLQEANADLDEQLQRLRSTEQALRLFKQVFDSTAEAILVTNLEALIVDVNDAYVAITGHAREDVVGRPASLLGSGRHDPAFYQGMWQALKTRGAWSGEIWNRRRDGTVFPTLQTINTIYDEQQRPAYYIGVFTDITRLKQVEQELEQLAYFDRLTGLPNRRLLLDRMEHAVKLAERSRSYGAVFFLDLDHFKHINDTLGHQLGDELLSAVAGRIKACVRSSDTVGRLAGDEFVVLAEELSNNAEQATAQAHQIGRKIVGALAASHRLGGKAVHCSASVGVVLFGGEVDSSVELLLSKADTAMYEAKKAGRAAMCLFEPSMWQDLQARVELESRMREALREDRFFLLYQPLVDMRGRVVGVEALVRWNDPGRGTVSPAEFIALAEETHLIIDIEKRVLGQVCQRLRDWQGQEGLTGVPIAMNVSAVHFNHPNFVHTLAQAISRYGINPSLLKIELTESVVMKDIMASVYRMRELQAMGIRLAMDDFGTGHSSLAYLRDLPFDQIKIDRSFIRHVDDDQNDRFIVHSVLTMAKFLRVDVVAEGVETEIQREALIAMSCQLFQGYLFSRPLPVEECENLVRSQSCQPTGSSWMSLL
ncbi:MAG TPA: hypothetical protein DHV21_15215 [Curvibacter sp.]|nr:hypothetical protein [Curvibacter sp.]